MMRHCLKISNDKKKKPAASEWINIPKEYPKNPRLIWWCSICSHEDLESAAGATLTATRQLSIQQREALPGRNLTLALDRLSWMSNLRPVGYLWPRIAVDLSQHTFREQHYSILSKDRMPLYVMEVKGEEDGESEEPISVSFCRNQHDSKATCLPLSLQRFSRVPMCLSLLT